MCVCVGGGKECDREGTRTEDRTKDVAPSTARMRRRPGHRLMPPEKSKRPAKEAKREEPRNEDVWGLY